ncbi:MAG: DedA family protein [Dactylosporangium sp.]|nr:VTT domain-containing protein [Dactylosporangium sp.]NNJ59673.1 DedA family protein [Dactylosporangium sp.]
METAEKAQAISDTLALSPDGFSPKDLIDPKKLIEFFGLFGVWTIMFAETGLLIGFFFPGDSLLFVAGVAASPVADEFGIRPISLPMLLIGAPICAIVGAQLGHFLGARYGTKMFDRPDSRLFKRQYVEKAEYYFEKFGPAKAVVLARFIPIVRTFLNPVAGVLGMKARHFLLWNIIGGILWTDGVLLAGWALAKQIIGVIPPEKIDTYLLPAVVFIVLVSVTPIFVEIIRDRRARRQGRAAPRPATSRATQPLGSDERLDPAEQLDPAGSGRSAGRQGS